MKIKSFSLNPEKWEGFAFVGGFGGYFFVLVVVFSFVLGFFGLWGGALFVYFSFKHSFTYYLSTDRLETAIDL